jgi:hypothetical protein
VETIRDVTRTCLCLLVSLCLVCLSSSRPHTPPPRNEQQHSTCRSRESANGSRAYGSSSAQISPPAQPLLARHQPLLLCCRAQRHLLPDYQSPPLDTTFSLDLRHYRPVEDDCWSIQLSESERSTCQYEGGNH